MRGATTPVMEGPIFLDSKEPATDSVPKADSDRSDNPPSLPMESKTVPVPKVSLTISTFAATSCGSVAGARFLQRRVIGRFPETQSSRGGGGSGLQGIGADPGPGPELPRAVECPKHSSERKHDNDGDVSALPERRRRIWRPLAKPKEARNFKDLKGLKCRYTFGIRAKYRFAREGPTPDSSRYTERTRWAVHMP